MDVLNKIAVSGLVLLIVFSGATAEADTLTQGAGVESVGLELPMPVIPDSLTVSADKADYVLKHFWDPIDSIGVARMRDAAFAEQNFVNFIVVFPYGSPSGREAGVQMLLDKLSGDTEAYEMLLETAEKYLYEPESPMMSEEFYKPFLDTAISSSVTDPTVKLRLQYQAELIDMNRPGTRASDFEYQDPRGDTLRMSSLLGGGRVLLIFYDPECDHCEEVIGELSCADNLTDKLHRNEVKVLAVYSGDNYDSWIQRLGIIPSQWTVGYDDGSLQDRGLYQFRSMPTLYLIDRDGTVILKEASPQAVLNSL